ncbi:MAG: UDP-N-acetylmuramoyl-L-alanine--D-glutamate ligase [Gemmatimonadales bacterium]|jgi:UDP-N-acetylmuramoylalanine--D-glutamate ligase
MKTTPAWADSRVAVLGLARSGRAATRLLLRAGASVYASDTSDSEELRRQAETLRSLGADIDLGRHDVDKLERCDSIVVSPGIPPAAAVLQAPALRGRRVVSELELAYGFLDAPVIAITGTNGKTTTTAWIGAMLERAGARVGIGGNIGRALSEIAADVEVEYEWVVVEVSSFQLAYIDRFKPAIGVFLNLCPDHLDWHGSVERYYADKARLFENGDAQSCWVLNGEDPEVQRVADGRAGEMQWFWVASEPPAGISGAGMAPDGRLVVRQADWTADLVNRAELRLLGLHNVANALAGSLAAICAKAPLDAVRAGLREFQPLPHRLQPVGEKDEVLWINDSKATNVASTRVALESLDRPVVLLLGGRGKGESFARLLPALRGRARAVVAYGETARQAEAELGQHVRLVREDGPFEAVIERAEHLAEPGDVVLLAPACASFDMFRDYEERGQRFMDLVRQEVA